jgi:hypothetical protein
MRLDEIVISELRGELAIGWSFSVILSFFRHLVDKQLPSSQLAQAGE